MARHGSAWSVKGVDQATRDIARRAAQAAGMTIGEWIDHAIRADAGARSGGAPTHPANTDTEVGTSGGLRHAAPTMGLRPETLEAVFHRLDDTDARFDATLRPIAYGLRDVAERLVAIEKRPRATARLTLPGTQQAGPRGVEDQDPALLPVHGGPVDQSPTPDGPPVDWSPEPELDAEALRRDAGVPRPADVRLAPVPPTTDMEPEPFTAGSLDPPLDERPSGFEQSIPVTAQRVGPKRIGNAANVRPARRVRRWRGWLWALSALALLAVVLLGAVWSGMDGRLDRPTLERKITEIGHSMRAAGQAAWTEIDAWTVEIWTEIQRLIEPEAEGDAAMAPSPRPVSPVASLPSPRTAPPVPIIVAPGAEPDAAPDQMLETVDRGLTPLPSAPSIAAIHTPPASAAKVAAQTSDDDTAPPISPRLAPPVVAGSSAPNEVPAVSEREALLARARAGDFKAQHDLAVALANNAVPDYAEAAVWFREAAINGVANAQYNLGVLHETGTGVPADATRALLWYHSAAEQGHPLAQYNLGVLYAAGRGIPQSYAEAGRWFRRAADRGVPGALYNLAVFAHEGLGRPADQAEAEQLFRRAAALDHDKARAWLKTQGAGTVGGVPALADTETTTAVDGALGAEGIADIQQRLLDRGLYDGVVDGIAGPRTRAAISRYQATEGLPVTGLPSVALIARLRG